MITTEVSQYKGNPVIKLRSPSKYTMTFGLTKARMILACIDEIRDFVDNNRTNGEINAVIEQLNSEAGAPVAHMCPVCREVFLVMDTDSTDDWIHYVQSYTADGTDVIVTECGRIRRDEDGYPVDEREVIIVIDGFDVSPLPPSYTQPGIAAKNRGRDYFRPANVRARHGRIVSQDYCRTGYDVPVHHGHKSVRMLQPGQPDYSQWYIPTP
jgi:hypothetical protein